MIPATPSTGARLLADAARRLAPVTETPRLDAELLLAHALGIRRSGLLGRLRDPLDAPEFEALLARRLNHEPIAYITGEWEFFSLSFAVRPPLLVPRPETEHLVEAALEYLKSREASLGNTEDTVQPRVVDIGTGTGCIAAAIARNAPHAHVVAVDIHPEAVACARENAARLHVALDVRQGNAYEALREADAPFDVIVSNPPYVRETDWDLLPEVIRRHEDRNAVIGGSDGLDLARVLLAGLPRWLCPGGFFAMEIDAPQRPAVLRLFADSGLADIRFRKDLGGLDRIAQGIFIPEKTRATAL